MNLLIMDRFVLSDLKSGHKKCAHLNVKTTNLQSQQLK